MAKTNLAALKKIKATKGAKTTEQFALDLLRKTAGFGNAEQLDKAKVIPSNDTVSNYLPNRVFYWGQDENRNYQTLLIELDKTAKELFDIPAFKQKNELLDVLEDILARISQLTLNGFARERARDASTKWGKQIETLVVLAVKDDKSDEKNTQHVVSFATVNQPKGYEESLDIFYVREFSDISDPTAIAKQNSLLKKRHFDLLNSSKWKDAFVTIKERNSARKLLDDCKKAKPNNDDIINSCVDLLQNMTSGYLRGQHNQKLKRIKLHSGHEIGRESNGSKISPLQGEAIRDQKDRLLGYLVYCVNSDTSADDIREFMENHNHFHNVLIIYPDTKNPTIELWQGKKRLEGKLRKDKSHFTGESKLVSVLTRFFAISSSNITNPEHLAKELAFRAKILKQVAIEQLDEESKDEQSDDMEKLYRDFKTALIHTITKDEFADAYAQTLTYGLLSARWVMAEEVAEKIAKGDKSVDDLHFSRRNAISYLPTSSGFLKQFFEDVLKNTADDGKVAWILGDIADLLDKVHIQYVFGEGDNGDPDADPIIHFYEPFLNAYDSEVKQRRGVYYTPQPVVNFIVRSVDDELKSSFDLEEGFASVATWGNVLKSGLINSIPIGVKTEDCFVKVLDPATGTGTFLVSVIDKIFRNLKEKWNSQGEDEAEQKKLWNNYVDKYLVDKLFGFEVMMASYAIAHLKISLKLRQTGYISKNKTEFNIILTNTLDDALEQVDMQDSVMAIESAHAKIIKKDYFFTVIIGNPPYANKSSNLTEYHRAIVDNYRNFNGLRIKERNQLQFEKNIQDDYVKFFAFSENCILKSGCGILSLISNATMYFSRSLRGMREHLSSTFEGICILDLHGGTNENLEELDNNVFDIEQSVGISIFLKFNESSECNITYSQLIGDRSYKFKTLDSSSLLNMDSITVNKDSENCSFRPVEDGGLESLRLDECFGQFGAGIKTNRDKIVISFDETSLVSSVIQEFNDLTNNDVVSNSYNILYRPFDVRKIFYLKPYVKSMSYPTMKHILEKNNIAIVASSSWTNPTRFSLSVTNIISEMKCGTHDRGTSILPLYRYESILDGEDEKVSNLNSLVIEKFKSIVGNKSFSDEKFLYWVVALGHSTLYKKNLITKLAQGFPIVLLPSSSKFFDKASTIGEKISNIYLHFDSMFSSTKNNCSFINSNIVAKGYPKYIDNKVYINKNSFFDSISPEVWSSYVGGYQVMHKWLKDRRGREISKEEIMMYLSISQSISKILDYALKIDDLIKETGGWSTAFQTRL